MDPAEEQARAFKPTAGKRTQGKIQFPEPRPNQRTLAKHLAREFGPEMRATNWSAEVGKFEYCRRRDYDHGKGLKTAFVFSVEEMHRRCILTAEAPFHGDELTLSIEIEEFKMDPSPTRIWDSKIPNEENLVSIRLLDHGPSLEVHLDPKPRNKSAARYQDEGQIFVFRLRTHRDVAVQNAKNMLRRVENLTLDMPDDWFRYRNYFTTTPNMGDEADEEQSDEPPITVGQHTVDFGGGVQLRLTGHLASAEFLALLGHKNIRDPDTGRKVEVDVDKGQVVARDPGAAVTRQQGKDLGQSFEHSHLVHQAGTLVPALFRSHLRFGVQAAKGTKKKIQAQKRAEKINRRAEERARRRVALNPSLAQFAADMEEANANVASTLPKDESAVNPVGDSTS
ncbi:MAG: hypothetical protein Q9202_007184 [Teloschistes flavicans]